MRLPLNLALLPLTILLVPAMVRTYTMSKMLAQLQHCEIIHTYNDKLPQNGIWFKHFIRAVIKSETPFVNLRKGPKFLEIKISFKILCVVNILSGYFTKNSKTLLVPLQPKSRVNYFQKENQLMILVTIFPPSRTQWQLLYGNPEPLPRLMYENTLHVNLDPGNYQITGLISFDWFCGRRLLACNSHYPAHIIQTAEDCERGDEMCFFKLFAQSYHKGNFEGWPWILYDVASSKEVIDSISKMSLREILYNVNSMEIPQKNKIWPLSKLITELSFRLNSTWERFEDSIVKDINIFPKIYQEMHVFIPREFNILRVSVDSEKFQFIYCVNATSPFGVFHFFRPFDTLTWVFILLSVTVLVSLCRWDGRAMSHAVFNTLAFLVCQGQIIHRKKTTLDIMVIPEPCHC
ncbi:unnamed protein product [Allacma fusca]|uniref:Envelope protein n=1 Tax=Allacma fusca TaxID=39272 RepID=A0A8J2NTG4_9HEXA|nr:unnamed protein product [Allacma fusca]